MHVMMINCSPRVEKYSNTDKIIDSFAEGLVEAGATYEKFAISNKKNWDAVREAYINNTEIIMAMPLYVENIPGILLEFLETLPVKDKDTRVSFIIQGGFAEASQLWCGADWLKTLPGFLGVSFGGTLYKGDNFGIRVVSKEDAVRIIGPYKAMGKAFVDNNGFDIETVKKFAGPEYFPLYLRIILQIMFSTTARKNFAKVSAQWGATVPIDHKPWE